MQQEPADELEAGNCFGRKLSAVTIFLHREGYLPAVVGQNAAIPNKDLAKAERLLNEALVADVRYGPAHNSLGMVYYLQDKLYLAAWEFEYAAKLMPEYAEPYNNLGLVYERAGKYEEAISYYSMAMSLDSGDPEMMGNLVRARMVNGEKGADLKDMISDLALQHPDPAWRHWAGDKVALGKFEGYGAGSDRLFPDEISAAEPTPVQESLPTPPADLEFPMRFDR